MSETWASSQYKLTWTHVRPHKTISKWLLLFIGMCSRTFLSFCERLTILLAPIFFLFTFIFRKRNRWTVMIAHLYSMSCLSHRCCFTSLMIQQTADWNDHNTSRNDDYSTWTFQMISWFLWRVFITRARRLTARLRFDASFRHWRWDEDILHDPPLIQHPTENSPSPSSSRSPGNPPAHIARISACPLTILTAHEIHQSIKNDFFLLAKGNSCLLKTMEENHCQVNCG